MMKRRILAVSDLHCGDNVAIMPPEVKESLNGDNRVHYANELQLELYKGWKTMCRKVGKVDAVFNIGDNINGPNYHEHGVGNWTNNLNTQVDAAHMLLQKIKCNKHFMVVGSKYHVASNPNAEEAIANLLRMDGDKVHVGRDLIVKVAGKTFHLLHNVGFSSNFAYRGTPLSRELMFALMRDVEFHGAKYLIRGHTHYFYAINSYHSGACICPGWKLRDDYAKKGSIGAADMRVGYVLITVDGDDVHFDYDGLKFKTNSEVCELK